MKGELTGGEHEAAAARAGTGMERPEELPPTSGPAAVTRTFAFVDLSGFTAFTDARGARAAVELLSVFRLLVAEVTSRRGIRVAKHLGDGAMVVGIEPGPTIAAVAELLARFDLTDLRVRAGVASGPVILFNGDDYIGRPVNLASRLCDAAEPGEVLAVPEVAAAAPDWVVIDRLRGIDVKGIGDIAKIASIALAPDVSLPDDGTA